MLNEYSNFHIMLNLDYIYIHVFRKPSKGKTIINNILLLQEEVINNILRCCLEIKCVCDLGHRQHVTTQNNVVYGYMLHWQDMKR